MVNLTGYSQEKSKLKLAMAQMLVEGGEKQKNLNRAVERIEEAAKNKADIILLPEAMDLGWTHSKAKTEAEPIPLGSTFQTLAKAAKMNKIYVCAGIIEKDGDRTFNSAVLINRNGELVLKHRKINELSIAHGLYDQGDRINVCETEFGTIGLLICADANAKDHVLTRSLGYLGADLILLPSSWAVKADHDNKTDPYGSTWTKAFNPVCKEFKLNIASVSNVGKIVDGPWKDWNCIGNSIFVENGGEEMTVLPYGLNADTIVYQDVTLLQRPERGTSWNKYWNSLRNK
ncbi:MAG: carbon-nitrogen hydrolase family protein [Prolixibacteraceae bacterium]|nr:carbon-nitrogen hydrolase family protein [Prolixibacteraceae bacterium]MBT6005195.1 carbon-nitrogen hydrolase family protein [Prolixibacteraceae bacterium]MBT6766089.1 carbon-nitrogen hydrolase family protein [Prolixibacteraceae bacterium]MBT6996843.1 carbon-nitrogen hydrolase family protein [Prolixibacteraceae bacterium]MBT7395274.1 carbon-nitrogen hydrolase family protein [Prolixibacteraceae bacterium]